MSQKLDNIIEFYGDGCPHCLSMEPVIRELEEKKKIEITKLEVWNNKKNKELMDRYIGIIGEACGGFAAVPSFVNTKTNQALCGTHDGQDIEMLIDGGDCSGNICKPHTKM